MPGIKPEYLAYKIDTTTEPPTLTLLLSQFHLLEGNCHIYLLGSSFGPYWLCSEITLGNAQRIKPQWAASKASTLALLLSNHLLFFPFILFRHDIQLFLKNIPVHVCL